MNEFEIFEETTSRELKKLKQEKDIDKISKIEEMILKHIESHIVIDLEKRYYDIAIKRYSQLTYADIASRWNVSLKQVTDLAVKHGLDKF